MSAVHVKYVLSLLTTLQLRNTVQPEMVWRVTTGGGAGAPRSGKVGSMARDTEGKRVDRRIVRSRKAIIEAFERLLLTCDLDKITVSAIAREANIDRKTFYVHFGTIDGLLDAIAEDIVDTIVDGVVDSTAGEGEADPRRALAVFFENVNRVVCGNLVMNGRFFESMPADAMMSRLLRPLKRLIIERGLIEVSVSDEVLDYYLSFILGGIISAYRNWLLSDRAVPVERVSEVALALTMHGLASIDPKLA